MKLLVATSQWFPDFRGGSGRVAAATARELAARGHDVTAVVPASDGRPADAEEHGVRVLRALPRTFLPESLTDTVTTLRAVRALRSPFDVLVAHHTPTAIGAARAQRGTPAALVYHASAVRELRFLRTRVRGVRERVVSHILEPPLRRFEREAVAGAARILALSDFSKSLLVADHGESAAAKIVRVLGGVDVERFAPLEDARALLAVPPETPLVVTARRLEPRMGIEELLRAVARLPQVTLAIIGSGMSERALRALAAELRVESRTRFLGGVDDETLRTWYAAADAVALPTVAYEGFGLVTVEALACGTPVVATSVGASPELLAPLDPSLVVEPTAEGLADGLTRTLALRGDKLRSRCREYAIQRFAWENVIGAWEDALELTAGTANSPLRPQAARVRDPQAR